jgi:hypothetical protein
VRNLDILLTSRLNEEFSAAAVPYESLQVSERRAAGKGAVNQRTSEWVGELSSDVVHFRPAVDYSLRDRELRYTVL